MIKNRDSVAYIVVSWNNKTLLDECIASIMDQNTTLAKKIILVDNDSKDGTVAYIEANYPDVVLLPQTFNYGFAKGNNIGIKVALEDASTKYVVLVNSDATLAPNWTQTLVDTALIKPKAACLQSVTLDYFNHAVIDSTHIFISRYGQATQSSWREPISGNKDVPALKVFGCNAAAMLITRGFIEAQPFDDFFDETMFMYLEDVDVAARATVMGWDNLLVPGTRAFHMGSVSSNKKDPRFSLRMTFRNNLGLLIKNLPLPILFTIIVRIPKSDIASMRHLKRIGKSYAIPAVIQGRLHSIVFIPIFIYKRIQLSKHKNIDKDFLWKLMRFGY